MQMLFENTCVICHLDSLMFRKREKVFGITSTPECYFCENCGSTFLEDELRWKLVDTKIKNHPIWQQFRQKSLYVREWLSVGNLKAKGNMLNNLDLPITALDILGIGA